MGIKKEVQIENCGCYHEAPDELVKSQWQSRTKSNLFLIYRWLLGIFFTAVVIWSMYEHATKYGPYGYYFIYLTNWGIMLCMTCTVLGAILVTAWHFHPELSSRITSGEMPGIFKFYWGLHNCTLILSLIITSLYWSVIYDPEKDTLDPVNVLTHATNSVFMFLDLIIVAHPVRLFHVIQPMLVGLAYGLFTFVYYAVGGTDANGNPYIYEPLDWRNPGFATVLLVIAAFAVIIFHFMMFWIYRLRSFLYNKYIAPKSYDLGTTSPNISMIGTAEGQDNLAYVCTQSEQVEKK